MGTQPGEIRLNEMEEAKLKTLTKVMDLQNKAGNPWTELRGTTPTENRGNTEYRDLRDMRHDWATRE